MEALKNGWWKLAGLAIVIALAWASSTLGWRMPDWAILPLVPAGFLVWLALDASLDGAEQRRY